MEDRYPLKIFNYYDDIKSFIINTKMGVGIYNDPVTITMFYYTTY